MDEKFFQVSVKGLCFDNGNKVLMIQEDSGLWELPGGRIELGEDFIGCLQRECLEEMGLACQVLDKQPSIVYPAADKNGRGRIMVFYKISFDNLNFKPSVECRAIKFCAKGEIEKLEIPLQLKKLLEFLK